MLPSPQVLVWKPFLTWLGGMSGTGTMARVGGIAAPGASPCAAPGAAIPCTHPRGLSPRRGPATTPGPAPRQTLPPCGPCSPLVAFSLAQQGCAGPPARGGGRQRRLRILKKQFHLVRPLLFCREMEKSEEGVMGVFPSQRPFKQRAGVRSPAAETVLDGARQVACGARKVARALGSAGIARHVACGKEELVTAGAAGACESLGRRASQ